MDYEDAIDEAREAEAEREMGMTREEYMRAAFGVGDPEQEAWERAEWEAERAGVALSYEDWVAGPRVVDGVLLHAEGCAGPGDDGRCACGGSAAWAVRS